MRVSLVTLIFLSLLTFLSINTLAAGNDELTYKTNSSISGIALPDVDIDSINTAMNKKDNEDARLAEIQRKLAIRQHHVNIINKFLIRKNSPVKNTKIAEIIYDKSTANNADYRILLAIMGVESGFCAQSFSYNCFGYLNGVHYPSYEVAFKDLVPKISRQYAAVYGTNFVALSKAYGQINWERGSAHLSMYYNQVGK